MGRELSMRRSDIISSNASLTSKFFPSPMILGLPCMAALIGVKNPFAAWRMIDACRSFPTMPWRVLRGTVFQQRMWCVSLIYAAAFFRWELYRTLDPVEPEPYRILSAFKVPVVVCQLIGRYWFLAAVVPCDCGWRE